MILPSSLLLRIVCYSSFPFQIFCSLLKHSNIFQNLNHTIAIHVHYASEKQPYCVYGGCKSNDFLSDNIMNSIWNLKIKLLFASCTVISHIDVFGWNLAIGQSGELHSLLGTHIPLGESLRCLHSC